MTVQTNYVGQVLHVAEANFPGVLAGLLIFLVFLLGSVIARRGLRRLIDRVSPEKRPLINLAGDTSYYGGMVIGGITGLGTMGINVSALIAGLGLSGFALGFALRDAVSNLIAGILILLYQPYRYGDNITVGGDSGVVTDINFRYTVLKSTDNKIIHVPNGTMFSNSVTVTRPPNV